VLVSADDGAVDHLDAVLICPHVVHRFEDQIEDARLHPSSELSVHDSKVAKVLG
jgi:hypothetical protein